MMEGDELLLCVPEAGRTICVNVTCVGPKLWRGVDSAGYRYYGWMKDVTLRSDCKFRTEVYGCL
jgi:hypothetical protein